MFPPQQPQYQDPQAEFLSQVTMATDLAADKFQKEFYLLFDCQREQIPFLFTQSSTFVWDGIAVSHDCIKEFLSTLPMTVHEHVSVDCQPIISTEGATIPPFRIIVNVSGDVRYGFNEQLKGFTHQFVLEQVTPNKNNTYFIRSFIVRLHDHSMKIPQVQQHSQDNRRYNNHRNK